MACLTEISSQRMRCRFKGSRTDSVVTTSRSARLPNDRGMIECNSQESGRVMTNIAGFGCHNVTWPFTCGDNTIMAIGAQVTGLQMVYGQDKSPPTRTGGMTSVTLVCCHWMGCRFIRGIRSGMTTRTRIRCLRVIEWVDEWQPGCKVMTRFAQIAG